VGTFDSGRFPASPTPCRPGARALVAPRRPKPAPGGTGRGGVFHSYAGSSRSSWPGSPGGVMCCGMILPERCPAVWRPP